MSDVFHLGLTRADLQGATIAILPGDPGRVERIAARFDRSQPLAAHRDPPAPSGSPASSPSSSARPGSVDRPPRSRSRSSLSSIRTFLRAGTTGAIQPEIAVGDLIVTTGSVRLDGASRHFAPVEYPAVADFDCTTALVAAARASGIEPHIGITASSDTFYPGQERYDTVSGFVRRELRGSADEWRRCTC
ncbi:MAG: uridine phosphorylase [Ilumatobacteraceae bacterium]